MSDVKITKMGWLYQLETSDRYPLESNKVFDTLNNAYNYIKNGATAYKGNVISVTEDENKDNNGVYYVKSVGTNGELIKLLDKNSQGEIISSVDTYVLEHSIFDLDRLARGTISELEMNIATLMQAVTDNKIVIAKYYESHNITSIPCICSCEDPNNAFYIEILLEKKIITITIDLTDLEEDVVTIYTKDITITELQEKLESGENIKTINNESILGKGNIKISTSTILDFTVEDVYHAHQEDTDLLGIETKSIVTDIDNKEQIYIHYDEQKQGIIPCGTYHGDEDYYYILFIADNNAFKLHIVDSDTTVYIDSIINLEDIKAEIEVDDKLSEDSTNPVQNKVITEELNKKANANAIPTNVSQLNNDSGYIKDVDAELSDASENPVQNKAINAELKKKIEGEIIPVDVIPEVGIVPTNVYLATPSGDPMHYIFEVAGAEYNETNQNKEKKGEYGDTYIHKSKRWCLNEIGNLTNAEMRRIYEDGWHAKHPGNGYPFHFRDSEYRTCLNRTDFTDTVRATYAFAYCNNIEVARIGYNTVRLSDPVGMFMKCYRLVKILGIIEFINTVVQNNIESMFSECYALKELRISKLKLNINLKDSSVISKESILYIITNEAAESEITLTLHPDAHDRLSTDESIKTALADHPLIKLKKYEEE